MRGLCAALSIPAVAILALAPAPAGGQPPPAGARPPAVPAPGPPGLAPVPRPPLGNLEAEDREQLEAERSELDRLAAGGEASGAELAAAYGRLGSLYLLYDLTDTAEPALADARALAPDEPSWSYYLGVLYQRDGRLDEAEASLARAHELRPDDLPTLLRLGQVRLARGELDAAGESFRAALEIEPRSAAALEGLGTIAFRRKRPREAIERFEAALEIQPGADALQHQLGLAYRDAGDLAAAREHLALNHGHAVRFADPLMDRLAGLLKGAAIHLKRGNAALQNGLLEVAIREYRQAVEIAPDDPQNLYNLGSALIRAGRRDEAIGAFGKAIALDPGYRNAHYNLAAALAEEGRWAEAAEHYGRAAEIDPLDHAAHLEWAEALLQAGRPARAAEELQALLPQLRQDEAPLAAKAQLELGHLRDRAGDAAGAAEHYRRAAVLAPDSQAAHAELAKVLGREGRFAEAAEELLPGRRAGAGGGRPPVRPRDGADPGRRLRGRPQGARGGPRRPARQPGPLPSPGPAPGHGARPGGTRRRAGGDPGRGRLPPGDEPGARRDRGHGLRRGGPVRRRGRLATAGPGTGGAPGPPRGDRAQPAMARALRARRAGQEPVGRCEPRRRDAMRRWAERSGGGAWLRRAVPCCLLVSILLGGASRAAAPAAPGIRFREVSKPWGLVFRHHHAGTGHYYMVETMGSGVAIFDYDGDGDPDVFMVDSGILPGYHGETPKSRLFRNDGGRFVDVTDRSGIVVAAYGMGAVAGDVDGDGDLDLYVTAFGPNQLFVNDGDGTFHDGTASAGVGDSNVGSGASFADVDRDGDLDLYAANYVDFTLEHNPICGKQSEGIRTYCHPDAFSGMPDVFYRNRGDGAFQDATAEAGFADAHGKGLGVLFSDFNEDGWPDLYVANDMTANFLFENRGGGRFEEIGLLSGTAFSDRGDPEAGMGIDVGDLDGDGLPEIMTTHMDAQTNAVYGEGGPWIFVDRRYTTRLAEPSVGKVGFGVVFADFDQDGDPDVAVANGHIIDNIELLDKTTTYKQRNQVFANQGKGRFEEVADSGLDVVRASRGMAAGDLDGDGDLDLVINDSNDFDEVYENVASGEGGWLQVALSRPDGNRFGIGARVTVAAGGRSQWREVRTESSYLSENQLPVHFGLGGARTVDRLTVRWPDGTTEAIEGLPADRRVELVRSPALAGGAPGSAGRPGSPAAPEPGARAEPAPPPGGPGSSGAPPGR